MPVLVLVAVAVLKAAQQERVTGSTKKVGASETPALPHPVTLATHALLLGMCTEASHKKPRARRRVRAWACRKYGLAGGGRGWVRRTDCSFRNSPSFS